MPSTIVEWRHSLAVDAARTLIRRGERDRAAEVLAAGPPAAADGTTLPWPSDLADVAQSGARSESDTTPEPQVDDSTPFDDLEDW